jgi:hypothetical protein
VPFHRRISCASFDGAHIPSQAWDIRISHAEIEARHLPFFVGSSISFLPFSFVLNLALETSPLIRYAQNEALDTERFIIHK